MKKSLVLFSLFVLFSGCLVSEKTDDLLSKIGSETCVSANAVAFDGIQVNFNVPNNAINFRVERDGLPILTTQNQEVTSTIDSGLLEGQTYRYACFVVLDVNDGYQQVGDMLEVTLEASTPPTFGGITSAVPEGADAVKVGWNLSSDAIISHYKVFKYIGTATSYTQFPSTPVATITDLSLREFDVLTLGDQIDYSFRVAACNSSDICDTNNIIITTSLPDTGAPTTTGATAINVLDGKVNLTVPWSDSNGLVTRRRIFRTSITTGTACPTVFGLYGNVNDVVITEPRNTPTNIVASGTLNEGTKYCFIVRDVDSLNQSELNMNIQEVEIGDLTPPSFTSPINLVRDSVDPEGVLKASWTAMLNESEDPLLGASEYLLYINSVASPASPDSDPCLNGTLYGGSGVSASSYAQGATVEVSLTGLNPRYNHRVCVRARDSSSNVSSQAPKALATTGDITAPSFAGIQGLTYNSNLGVIEYSFIVPSAVDIKEYKINTVRTRGGVTSPAIILTKTFSGLTAGQTVTQSFTLGEANVGDNDTIAVKVDVCDDASPTFNSIDNCSATAAEETITLPDATPPQGFTGITLAESGTAHRSIRVHWSTPPSWNDYVGFKIYYVNSSSQLVGLNSTNCLCASNDCAANPINSCEVSVDDGGSFLEPSRNYEMYVSAFDLVGNQTISYIAYTGPSKITGQARAQDIVAPVFNANFVVAYEAGAKITFDKAVDGQYTGAPDNLTMQYQIFRKEGATFTCPSTPDSSSGGCDGLTPMVTVAENTLTENGGKLEYIDTTVTDGIHYYYQFCAVDYASNKTCNTGSIGDLDVVDVTAPTIVNIDSNKTVGGGGSWDVTFDIADNSVSPENLIVKVYKSTVTYPDQSNPGAPVFEAAGGTVIVTSGTGASIFTDTGVPDVESVYYLIQVQDLNGNKTYAQARDMTPAPVITSVVWEDPIYPDGEPRGGTQAQAGDSDFRITINGSNLESIQEVNEAGSGADQHDIRHCDTSRILSNDGSQISCRTSSKIYYGINYELYIVDKHGRSLIYNTGSPHTYCQYAVANGITDLRGLGTSSRPRILCSSDHIKQIGLDADNPNNSEDIIGYFQIGQDIDFAGVTDFKGIPSMPAGDFFLDGVANRKILNLSIDTSATNEDAAFLLGCSGSTTISTSMLHDITFENADIKTGTGRGAVVMVEKNCDWPINAHVLDHLYVRNSEVHSNNTSGLLVAEFVTNGDEAAVLYSYDSTLYSTRPDDTTSVGSIIGKLSGNVTSGIPEMYALRAYNTDLRPAVGSTDAGYNIGGVIGQVDVSNVILNELDFNYGGGANFNDIVGGLDYIGGIIGQIVGPLSNITIKNADAVKVRIDDTGSSSSYRGGIVGRIVRGQHGNVNGVVFDSVDTNDVNILGDSYLGGMVGQIYSCSNISFINESRVYNTDVVASGNFAGGYIGRADTVNTLTMNNVHAYNVVHIYGANRVGGLIGELLKSPNSTISESHFRGGSINSTGAHIGGLIGLIDKSNNFLMDKAAVGAAPVVGGTNVGGLIGLQTKSSNFTVTNSYVNVDSTNVVVQGQTNVGGLIGRVDYSNSATSLFNIEKNAVFGKVLATTSGGAFLGSYVAATDPSLGVFANNYYRNDFTGLNILTDNSTYSGVGEIEGKSSAELGVEATYVNWDFVNDWFIYGAQSRAKLFIYSAYTFL